MRQIAMLLLLAVMALPAIAAPPPEAVPDRTVVFADVHGGYGELVALLTALNVIDQQGRWIAGATRLISLGDLLDRGADSRRVLDLLMGLETQAPASGGEFHLVLGNHELMNLTGDLRYLAPGELAAFAADEDPATREQALAHFQAVQTAAAAAEAATAAGQAPAPPPTPEALEAAFARQYPPGFFAHRAAFRPDGTYGRWLLDRPEVLVLDGTAYVHGGLSGHFASQPIAAYNERAHAARRALLDLGQSLVTEGVLPPWEDLLFAPATAPELQLPVRLQALRDFIGFGATGPAWYRGTATCHPLIEGPRFARVLAATDLDRVIMGHTPTNPRIIQSRFDGRAILADTGMLGSYYRGRPAAVVIEGGSLTTLTLSADGRLQPARGRPAVDIRADDPAAFREALQAALAALAGPDGDSEGGSFTIEIDGRTWQALRHTGRTAEPRRRLAALALDEMLGFGLLAPLVRDGKDGERGVVEVYPASSIDEAARQSAGLHRRNDCEGSSDYQLMYALDALLGMDIRHAADIHYDRATWLMYLTGQDAAFPTTARLPRYLAEREVRLPSGLASRLAALDAADLEVRLGSLLSNRQIRAILSRRDQMLASWPTQD